MRLHYIASLFPLLYLLLKEAISGASLLCARTAMWRLQAVCFLLSLSLPFLTSPFTLPWLTAKGFPLLQWVALLSPTHYRESVLLIV